MKRSISLILSLVLAAGALVTAMAPAFAHEDQSATASASTSMSYKAKRDKMIGTVSSGNGECVGNRSVKVYKITRKGKSQVGSAKTDSTGLWKVSLADAKGKYGASVVAKNLTLDNGLDEYGDPWSHTLECKAGTASVTV